jgi:hypothetical protein
VVVHVDLFPDAPAQERGGIPVIWNASGNRDDTVRITPGIRRQQPVFGPVPDLPERKRVLAVIQLELFLKISLQRPDFQGFSRRNRRI